MLKILTVPEEMEILRRKSRPILKFDEELAEFLRELGETLKGQKDPAGVGLSAIQVGKPIRAFAMFLPVAPKESYFAPEASGLALAKSDPSGFGRTGGFLQGKNPGPSEKAKPELKFYVNPEMVEHAAEMTLGEELTENRKQRTVNSGIYPPSSIVHRPFLEGCLSIPRIYGAVLRYPWIKARATVITENDLSAPSSFYLLPSSFTLEALASRVFQHELDHLNGILFTDHVLAEGNKLYREEGREMAEYP